MCWNGCCFNLGQQETESVWFKISHSQCRIDSSFNFIFILPLLLKFNTIAFAWSSQWIGWACESFCMKSALLAMIFCFPKIRCASYFGVCSMWKNIVIGTWGEYYPCAQIISFLCLGSLSMSRPTSWPVHLYYFQAILASAFCLLECLMGWRYSFLHLSPHFFFLLPGKY